MTSKPQTKHALILERETNSSIELQRAKDGTYYFTIKLYFEEGEYIGALEMLQDIDQRLRDTYLPKPEEVAP